MSETMSAIKRFFEKKKAEVKFRKAGPGHKLSDASSSSSSSSNTSVRENVIPRMPPPESAQRAGAAALARFDHAKQHQTSMANRSQQVIRAEALRQLEAERKERERMQMDLEGSSAPQETKEVPVFMESAPVLSVSGVYFRCPLIGPEVLPRKEMKLRIREFLYQQLEEERGLTACLIIHTCNSNAEKVNMCVQTLCKYLDNLTDNPSCEKFQKIRINNKVFQDRVAGMEGVEDFLLASGFEMQQIPPSDEAPPEAFYVFPIEKLEHVESLPVLRDALMSAEPILPELDRGVKVLAPSPKTASFSLPPEFYTVTAEELKREQQLRTEAVERNSILRTKAMRERDEIRELRRYRYTLLRIRFADGLILQGTFTVGETLQSVRDFVAEHLENNWLPFVLSTATGHRLSTPESTLFDLKLVPAAIVNFAWEFDPDPTAAEPVKFLSGDAMSLLQSE